MDVPQDQVAEFFTKETTWMNLGLLASCSLKIYQQKLTVESWFSIIFLACFGMSFLLSAIGIYTSGPNERTSILIRRCNMAYWTTILRIAAAAALLMFLDINHAVVAGPIFTLVLFFLNQVHRTLIGMPRPEDRDRLDYIYWHSEGLKKMKRHLDISREVVSISFACLCGTVLGYMKGTWTLTYGYKAPECFVFYSFVLALLVVLLSTVPHRVIPEARCPIANTYMPILTYASLLFLVVASIMAAQEIVREYVFLALLPVITIFMRCLLSEYNRNLDGTPHGNTFSGSTALWTHAFVPYITISFLALMASHSKYGIGTDNTASLSWWFKGFVISALCSIPIYASRTVIFAETKCTKNPALPTEPWDRAAFVTTLITIVCFIIVLRHHLDDFTNIF